MRTKKTTLAQTFARLNVGGDSPPDSVLAAAQSEAGHAIPYIVSGDKFDHIVIAPGCSCIVHLADDVAGRALYNMTECRVLADLGESDLAGQVRRRMVGVAGDCALRRKIDPRLQLLIEEFEYDAERDERWKSIVLEQSFGISADGELLFLLAFFSLAPKDCLKGHPREEGKIWNVLEAAWRIVEKSETLYSGIVELCEEVESAAMFIMLENEAATEALVCELVRRSQDGTEETTYDEVLEIVRPLLSSRA